MYSLHTPSVTVNCGDCYRYNHCKLYSTNNLIGPITDCRRCYRSISVKSIVAVMSHRRDATKKFAIATMRKNFATNFHSALCPPFS